MTFPFTISIGGWQVSLHGLLEFMGVFIAFRYYLFLRKRTADTIPSEHRLYVVTGAALGAVLGSRMIGAAENIPEWIHSTQPMQYFLGNKTLVGGLLGGLAGVELAKKIIGEKQRTGDLFVYPLILGMIIGRLGCFSTGVYEETYGYPSSLPWAMDLGDGIYRHPVTLYEIIFLVILWIVLRLLQKNYQLQSGALFKIFMIAYLLFRFLLDFIKPGWRYAAGLGTIQLTCIAGLLYYHRYLLHPSYLLHKIPANAR